jgi:hypothetical protein
MMRRGVIVARTSGAAEKSLPPVSTARGWDLLTHITGDISAAIIPTCTLRNQLINLSACYRISTAKRARAREVRYGSTDRDAPHTLTLRKEIFKMDPEKLLEAINEIVNGLRADMTKHGEEMSAKYDACLKKVDAAGVRQKGLKADDDGDDDPTMATRTAADRQARSDSANDRAAIAALARSVADLKKSQERGLGGDRNAFADAQARADKVMRTFNEQAEPPMSGEDIVAYNIRLARKMQPHSPRWKGVELSLISPDKKAFANALDDIRADALAAGNSPVGMAPLQHRMITKVGEGGHTIREFIGNGTIFKQLSRPVRHVAYIGTRTGTWG